ncbi:hypothetical protein PILCRDRAFT_811731 [Piloderma croceum F 1598]|uniref:Uncharacterized protein n=1 Tax=Piloderma croceum (strain F 1598) TaxID=765440 RepID=A0A0C3GKU2_PILCF|nr:hypothetical protein PILCRDRAFT_811731 [Piloderma croceum F 1598]
MVRVGLLGASLNKSHLPRLSQRSRMSPGPELMHRSTYILLLLRQLETTTCWTKRPSEYKAEANLGKLEGTCGKQIMKIVRPDEIIIKDFIDGC